MTIAEVGRLNDGQRDCLRLVLLHLSSKEIARELDISPHTVDQRLRTAMRTLNVQSRFEAARKFAALDPESAYQSLIYQSPDVELRRKNGKLETSAEWIGSGRPGLMGRVAEGKDSVPAVAFEKSEAAYRRLPIPRYRGEKNSFGTIGRLGWILVIAIAAAFSFGGLIAGLEALSRLKGS